jgi:hypothetical protein
MRNWATSRRSRVSSAASGFCWPSPGKACRGSASCSRTHLRRVLRWSPRSRAPWAMLTPRSVTNRTASSLYSRLNRRLDVIPTSGLNKNT